ncbi:MAG: 2Fe-2S iron-sulfur cluster-binding protein [Pseudomonadota bacterium]
MSAPTAAATRQLRLTLTVNGEVRTLVVEPRTLLVDALREGLGLTGVKEGGMDGTGACTVLLDGEPVHSSTMFAVQAHGRTVTTIEGLADGDTLTALQQAMLSAAGTGYSAPGMIMLATGALARDPTMDNAAIEALLADNLSDSFDYDTVATAIRAARDAAAKAA